MSYHCLSTISGDFMFKYVLLRCVDADDRMEIALPPQTDHKKVEKSSVYLGEFQAIISSWLKKNS